MPWDCQYCTLINQDELWSCDGCGSLRPASASSPRPSSSSEDTSTKSRGLGSGLRNVFSGAVNAITTFVDDVVFMARDTVEPLVAPTPAPPSPEPYSIHENGLSPSSSFGSPARSIVPSPSAPELITLSDSPMRPVVTPIPAGRKGRPLPPIPGDVDSNGKGARPRGTSHGRDHIKSAVRRDHSTPATPITGARDADNFASPRSPSTVHSLSIREKSTIDDREAEHGLRRIQLLCQQLNTNFIDDEFPPTLKSLGELYDREDGAIPGRLRIDNIVWLRPTEMFTKDGRRFPWTVFSDPRSSDIEQGALGDCWLLSAMALIAERPDVLNKILLTRVYNELGVYQLRICVDGQWRVVTVDDAFPCKKNTRTLAFAVGRKNQLWVPLVEKAYAKALGNYGKLRAGRTVEGLALLTGAPCESISLEDEDLEADLIWAQLLSAKEAGYIMGASCGAGSRSRVPAGAADALGLLTQHAYSLLDVRQEGGHRLLRVRNPWGSHVWKGDWSDGWREWPAEMKKRLLPSGRSESGTFWISYDDFRLYFDAVDLAKIRDHLGWAELRVPCTIGGAWAHDSIALMLVVEQPTELVASLFRGGSRTADDSDDLMICVHAVDHRGRVGELERRSDRKPCHMATTGDFFLRSGHYVVTILSLNSFNRGSFRMEASLVVHSNRRLFGESIACPPQMSTDSLVQVALKEGKVQSAMLDVVPRFLTKKFGGLLVLVDNTSKSNYVHVKADCGRSSNVLSSRGALSMIDSIPPMSRQIIVVLSHFDSTNAYVVENHLQMRTSRLATLGDWTATGDLGGVHAVYPQNGRKARDESLHLPPFDHTASEHLHAPRSVFY